MTEIEVFEGIHKDCGSLEICDYKNTGCSDCVIRQTLIKAEKALEEVQAYRAIGTVEEFKAFKLGRLGNKGFITIGQTMEEYAQKIRAKAIDEFAERMKADLQGEHWTQFCTMRTMIDKALEQLKEVRNDY